MLKFGDSLTSFLSALFGFINDLMNTVFTALTDFVNGIDITFP